MRTLLTWSANFRESDVSLSHPLQAKHCIFNWIHIETETRPSFFPTSGLRTVIWSDSCQTCGKSVNTTQSKLLKDNWLCIHSF